VCRRNDSGKERNRGKCADEMSRIFYLTKPEMAISLRQDSELSISRDVSMYTGKLFYNRNVSEIIGISPRQVISWTEKGLVEPEEPAKKAGMMRGYSYLNLLEFSLSKILLDVLHLQFYEVRNTLDWVRRNRREIKRLLRRWSEAKEAAGFIIMYHYPFADRNLFLITITKEEKEERPLVRDVPATAFWTVDLGKIKRDLDNSLSNKGYV
jgi:DNA-binding transcriptional MerR regulator